MARTRPAALKATRARRSESTAGANGATSAAAEAGAETSVTTSADASNDTGGDDGADDDDDDAGTAGTTGSAPPPSGTIGCGKDPGFTGMIAGSINVAGMDRTFLVALPQGYDPNIAYPIVFAWHGRGGDGEQAWSYFGVEQEAAADGGTIVVYPDGLPQANMANLTGWDLSSGGVDVQLFDALLTDFASNLCFDAERVFSTGHSFGGYFSNTLGCARSNVLRAIAPVAGGGPYFGCGDGVAAWLTHGGGDPVIPFSEGEFSRDHWLEANGCGTDSVPTTPGPCLTYEG